MSAPDPAGRPGPADDGPDPLSGPGAPGDGVPHTGAPRDPAAPGPDSGQRPAPGTEVLAPEADEEPAHRLSRLTMVTAPIKYLRSLVVPLGATVIAGTYNVNPWILGSAAVAIAGMLITGLLTYLTFRYRIGADRVEIHKGLINKSRRSIPLERVRGVDITSSLLHRVLGLAVVKIDAAAGGGGTEEGKLDAVTRDEAERLRDLLLRRKAALTARAGASAPAGPAGPADAATGTAAEGAAVDGVPGPAAAESGSRPAPEEDPLAETVYFRMPNSWYFYAVLSLGYLLTPFAAIAAVVGFLGQSMDELRVVYDPTDDAVGAAEELAHSSTLVLIGLGIAVVVLLLLMMPVFAVISYAVTHWGFTLLRRGDSLVAERGLFTRQSVTLEHGRIRGHELADNPLQRSRSAVRLSAIVTGLGNAATRATLLPMGPRDLVMDIVGRALAPYRGTLVAHPRYARNRRLFRAIVPSLLAGAVAAVAGVYWLAPVFAVLALLGIPLGIDRYRSLGHGFDGERVSVRSGSLMRRQAVVSTDAVIGWNWSQSPFQRRVGLATLSVTVGAGEGSYEAVDADFADSVGFTAEVTPAMVRPFLVADDAPAAPGPTGAAGE